ncbi:MAG TPA: glycine cleavage T C-terminal barrel domain-containing protein [Terriglobia bacterium]|nr:glycine cleavage T C-terminal barrel domain-containing protein [Terriglobia bacterium]
MNLPELYHAARHGAAVVRQPWTRGLIRLAGPDRISWLQGMVTNDVEKLLPGQGAYAAHLNAQGKIVAQMTVLVDADVVWLSLEASNVQKLSGILDRMIVMEDVQSEDRSTDLESITVIGPSARSVLETWLGEPIRLTTTYDHQQFSKCPRIVRDELGYTIWADPSKANAILEELRAAGATPIDEATWNIVRTEAGLPVYGVDIDETTTLPELGEKGIRYDKGCYIGQEVVARIKYIGHVNRRFMGFISDADKIPDKGSVVQFGGKDAGYITTIVVSPQMEKAIALGFVNRIAATSGTSVELVSGERRINSKVSELPFTPSATWSAD